MSSHQGAKGAQRPATRIGESPLGVGPYVGEQARELPEIECRQHARSPQFGIRGVDELEPLVDDVPVKIERVDPSPDVIRLFHNDDFEPPGREDLGGAQPR
jgi:hypothetical protein